MNDPNAHYLLSSLRGWLAGETPDAPAPDAVGFLGLLRLNRMEGLFHRVLENAPGIDADLRGACENAYRAGLVAGFRQSHLAREMLESLDAAGIPCVAFRGPFAGMDLYGDVALRRFNDLDLYILKKHAGTGWRIFREHGYRLRSEGMPRGFFLRNHLHWMFVHQTRRNVIDLHWAVDHPYQMIRVPYQEVFGRAVKVSHEGLSWRQPEPGHLLLLHAAHLHKHLPDAAAWSGDEGFMHEVIHRGELRHWMDVARVMQRHSGCLVPEACVALAREWRIDTALYAALNGLQVLFPGLLDARWSAVLPDLATRADLARRHTGKGPRLLGAIARRGDFRADRFYEARRYILPPADCFVPGPARSLRRAGHAVAAGSRMALALGDGIACSGVAAARKGFRRITHGVTEIQVEESAHG